MKLFSAWKQLSVAAHTEDDFSHYEDNMLHNGGRISNTHWSVHKCTNRHKRCLVDACAGICCRFDPSEIRAEAPQTTGGFPCSEKNFTNALTQESNLQEWLWAQAEKHLMSTDDRRDAAVHRSFFASLQSRVVCSVIECDCGFKEQPIKISIVQDDKLTFQKTALT